MLSKSKRIPRRDFKPLLDSRLYFNSEHFSLRVATSEKTRLSVSVSKKVSKSAVVRNKVRRRVYTATKTIWPSLNNNLYLVISKKGAEKLKGEVLQAELVSLFKRV